MKFIRLACFQNLLFCLIAISLFSFPGLATNVLDEEIAIRVSQRLDADWEVVGFKKPLGFDTIFSELSPNLWPALPESYEWCLRDNTVTLRKHKLAASHDFEFVTYITDCLTRFNFLSRWDGVTHHSFAYTLKNSPLAGNESVREAYPIPVYTYNGVTYMRGHCVDFLDTYGFTDLSVVAKGTVIESISTLDPRNFIPEPYVPTAYWGQTLRKNLVGEIRENNGCYAQYVYYGPTYIRTDDKTATAIPEGIFFVRLDSKQTPQTSYHVPWSHKIHEQADEDTWKQNLATLEDLDTFMPRPYVNGAEAHNDLPLTYELPVQQLSYKDYFRLVKAADHEVSNVMGKVFVIISLLRQKPSDIVQIQSWLKRLIDHGMLLHEMDCYGFLPSRIVDQLLGGLSQASEIDKQGNFYQWVKHLCLNDAERRVTSYSDFQPLIIEIPTPAPKIKEVDIDYFSADGSVNVVLRELKNNPRVRLLNISTTRARRIAESIKAVYSSPKQRQDFVIEYALKPNPSQTSGVRKAFTDIGIQPIKIETSSSSLTEDSNISNSSVLLPPDSDLLEQEEGVDKCLELVFSLSAEQQEDFLQRFLAKRETTFQETLDNTSIGEIEGTLDSENEESDDEE